MRLGDKGVRQGRGWYDHVCGVLNQGVAGGGVSGDGVLAVAYSAVCLREHFIHRHFRSKVLVVQEGAELLPCCDLCRIHMPAGRLIKHQRTVWCDNNTQIRRQRMGVAIADKCSGVIFSITGKDKAECIEGVKVFKYLGRLLDWSDDDWPLFLRNINKAWQV